MTLIWLYPGLKQPLNKWSGIFTGLAIYVAIVRFERAEQQVADANALALCVKHTCMCSIVTLEGLE